MSEFRVAVDKASQRRREGKIRLAVWGTVPLLLIVAVVGIFISARFSNTQVNIAFTWIAVLIVVGTVVGAHFFGARLGLESLGRDTIFLLTEEALVRRRAGWPDVRIALSEVGTLVEGREWLVIKSVAPARRIAIPKNVDGFASLRSELAKHGEIIVQRQRSLLGLIPIVVSFLCWGEVFWSRNAVVVRVAAIIALCLLASESFLLGTWLRQSSRRLVVWIWLVLGWIMAFLVVYFRVLRRS